MDVFTYVKTLIFPDLSFSNNDTIEGFFIEKKLKFNL